MNGNQEMEKSLENYQRMFLDAIEAARDERTESDQARDYYDGKQYTAEEREILAKRRQPPTTLNRVARKVNHLLGVEIDRRSDPKALARTEKHVKAAEAITDSLRYVEQKSKLDETFSALHENMLIEGFGAFELVVKEGRGGRIDIGAEYWQQDRLFYDPHSVKADFSDAMYLGGYEWVDYAKAVRMFPDKIGELQATKETPDSNTQDQDTGDKPDKAVWRTVGTRARLRIVQMYHIGEDGEWYLCKFTGGGILENEKVAFVDEDGKTFCPMVMQSSYVDRDGDRYGEVRNLISPQDMINKTHSKLQHLISVRQVIAEEGAISEANGGIDGARQELAKPDGIIIVNGDRRFEINGTADMVSGHASLLQEFKGEIDLMGPNASMQGKGPQSQSGRALMAQQEGGMREFSPVADKFNSMKEKTYRYIWFLIKQFWTEPMAIRVLDDEQAVRFVNLNKPLTRMEMATARAKDMGLDPNDIQAQIMADPMLAMKAQEVGDIENPVAEIDVDIMIEVGPNLVSLQGEEFAAITQMASAGIPIPPDIIIEASSLRNKDKILERMRGSDDPQAQQQAAQAQAMQQHIAMEKAQAEIEKDKSSAFKNYAGGERDLAEAERTAMEPIEVPLMQ